jgi:hypothetical protein
VCDVHIPVSQVVMCVVSRAAYCVPGFSAGAQDSVSAALLLPCSWCPSRACMQHPVDTCLVAQGCMLPSVCCLMHMVHVDVAAFAALASHLLNALQGASAVLQAAICVACVGCSGQV